MKYEKDKNTIKYMYRYLEKFTGTYKVLPDIIDDFPRDDNGNIEESFEDLYIPCRKGVIKHTYEGNDILAWCCYDKISVGKNVIKELKDKFNKLDFKSEFHGNDVFIYFNAKDIDKIAKVVYPKTNGSKVKWSSSKNIPKRSFDVPEECMKEYNKLIEKLDTREKMNFSRKCHSGYIASIDAKSAMKESGLNPKEYIYSVGKWDDFIKYVKKELKAYK